MTEQDKIEKRIREHEEAIFLLKRQKVAHHTEIIRLRGRINVQCNELNRVLKQ